MGKPDGGSAFPLLTALRLDPRDLANEEPMRVVVEGDGGMSLRDYFAGKALAGMHARDSWDPGLQTPEQRAANAYIDADAMMKARK